MKIYCMVLSFKLILFKFFTWRIIALQCCVCFCNNVNQSQLPPPSWVSPPLCPSPPIPLLSVVTERQSGLPVLRSSFPLAICFTHDDSCVLSTLSIQFSSIQSLSRVWLFATSWIAARQASLSITNSQSLPKPPLHQVSDAIQPSHPLLSPSPPAPNPSQHQSLFQWVNSSHEVAKGLEFQLQHQSFQWTPWTDLL